MRARALPIAVIAAATVALAVGCGSSDGSGYGSRDSAQEPATATATSPEAPPGSSARACEGTTARTDEVRVTGIECDVARRVVAAWAAKPDCSRPADASRFSCSLGDGFRCLGAATERGVAASCSRPGSSVAFVARRG
jgi:hypothetical protein